MKVTPDAVMEFLHAIERGEIKLTPERCPQDVYAGCVAYKASNGWILVIFNDCNEWDYVSEIVIEDGTTTMVNFWCYTDGEDLLLDPHRADEDLDPQWEPIRRYQPRPAHVWSIYRIPGYLNWRCERCNKWAEDDDSSNRGGFQLKNDEFLCGECAGPDPATKPQPTDGLPELRNTPAYILESIESARQEIIDDEAKLLTERRNHT
jgi:hypothetical protein